MRIGELRRRVTVQQKTVSQDTVGQEIASWGDLTSIWCHIAPATGSDIFVAQQIKAEITHRIDARWRPEFANPQNSNNLRIVYATQYATRIFNVTAILNQDERNKEVIIYAVEGLANV